jgi:hypothetical protein
MARKYEAIDIIQLYAISKDNTFPFSWNAFLTRCLETNSINELVKVRYGIQAGMDDAVKRGFQGNEKLTVFYCRVLKSIEDTAKKIIRKTNPMPNDNHLKKGLTAETLKAKRKRDQSLEQFLKKSSY